MTRRLWLLPQWLRRRRSRQQHQQRQRAAVEDPSARLRHGAHKTKTQSWLLHQLLYRVAYTPRPRCARHIHQPPPSLSSLLLPELCRRYFVPPCAPPPPSSLVVVVPTQREFRPLAFSRVPPLAGAMVAEPAELPRTFTFTAVLTKRVTTATPMGKNMVTASRWWALDLVSVPATARGVA